MGSFSFKLLVTTPDSWVWVYFTVDTVKVWVMGTLVWRSFMKKAWMGSFPITIEIHSWVLQTVDRTKHCQVWYRQVQRTTAYQSRNSVEAFTGPRTGVRNKVSVMVSRSSVQTSFKFKTPGIPVLEGWYFLSCSIWESTKIPLMICSTLFLPWFFPVSNLSSNQTHLCNFCNQMSSNGSL